MAEAKTPARVHCFGIDELDGERGELRKAKAAAAAAGPGAADSADASGAPRREWGILVACIDAQGSQSTSGQLPGYRTYQELAPKFAVKI